MSRTINSRCKAINVYVSKGDDGKGKAEAFYKKAGEELAALKLQLKGNPKPWYEFVQEQCGLSQQRADELIRIANGKTTLGAVRAAKAEGMKKSRSKSENPKPRGVGSAVDEPTKSNASASETPPQTAAFEGAAPPQLFVAGEGCDYESTDEIKVDDEPYRVTRLRGYRASAKEAIRYAKENLMVRENRAEWAALDPSEITDEVIAIAQSVVDAWTETIQKLHQLRGGMNHEAEIKNAVGASVH